MARDDILDKIEELRKIFVVFNKYFYSNALPLPTIVLNTSANTNNLGWCKTRKFWKNETDTNIYYEISINPELLKCDIKVKVNAILHEMVHLYNLINDIKDCSRNRTYHNTRFKKAAESHGLKVKFNDKYGWEETDILPATNDYIKEVELDKVCKKSDNKKIKYKCPECGIEVYTDHLINISCMNCNIQMIEK